MSQIKEFFEDQTVFITGGTGFLGKILIEKLLRECEGIKRIYVLVRYKKGISPEQRFSELFNYACFDVLKAKNKSLLDKVSLVTGDCQQPVLGLSEQDVNILLKETTCVIHAAANVKFDQTLREAACYVRATRDLLELARQMSNLKVFVFVSTAFSNCVHSHIKEEFYEPPMKSERLLQLVNCVDDNTLEAITPKLLGTWPNAYVYSKCISEDLINTIGVDLPITIVRPAIVISTIAEPIIGWIDNFYGAVGIVVGCGLGVIRVINAKLNIVAPLVPVDYVSNCILASAWKRYSCGTNTIYNFVGHENSPITWAKLLASIESHYGKIASVKAVWYCFVKVVENRVYYKICRFFMHTVPAYIADFVLLCLGKPTLAVKGYQRLHKMMDLLTYFSTRSWSFENGNVMKLWNDISDVDKKMFCFNMEDIDYDSYIYDSILGARLHLLKESQNTISKANRKVKILFVAHYIFLALLCYLLYKFVLFIFGLLF